MMKSMFICYIAVIFIGVVVECSNAQVLPFHYYNTRDGLISNGITCLYQDRKGFLWIGTGNGISVFDGRSFTNFSSADGLAHDYVTSIIEDRFIEGKMWFSTWGGGVSSYYNGKFNTFATSPRGRVRKVLQDKEGTVWCSDEKQLVIIKDNHISLPPTDALIPAVEDIVSFGDSVLYFANMDGITTYSIRTRALGSIRHPEIYGKHVWLLCATSDGKLYGVRNDNLLFSLQGDSMRIIQSNFLGGENLMEGPNGELWTVNDEGWVKYYPNTEPPSYTAYTATNGLPENGLKCSLIDREGTIWLGTWTDGLIKLSQRNVSSFPFTVTPAVGQNYAIAATDTNDHLWLLGKKGLEESWRDSNGTFHFYLHTLPGTFKESWQISLTFDSKGTLWLVHDYNSIASYSIRYHPGKESQLKRESYFQFDEVHNTAGIATIYCDSQNRIWYGKGPEGIFVLDTIRKTGRLCFDDNKMNYPEIKEDYVRVFREDHTGRIWAGYFRIGLVRLEPPGNEQPAYKIFTRKNGLPEDRIRSILEDGRGRVWVGTDTRGIAIFDRDNITTLSMKDGLPSNAILFLSQDSQGRLWIGTGRGLVYLENPESKVFKQKNDILTDKIVYAGGTFKNGSMWFLTANAVTIYDAKNDLPLSVAPPVYLTHLSVNGNEKQPNGNYEFSHHENNIIIDYVGLSFRDEKAVRYRYRLRGAEQDWHPWTAGASVSYSALRPGEYVFEVKASNLDGIESVSPATVSFIIVPPFWQRWWFYSIVGVCGIGALYIIVRRRVNKLQAEAKQQQEFSRKLIESQEQERKRIAAELHDGLGQNLLLIYNQIVLGKKSMEGKPEILNQLDEVSQTTSRAIEEVREITYNLRPFILDRLGLTQALVSLVERSNKSTAIIFNHEIDTVNGLFTKEDEMNIYRIVQEGMNNIVKHSQATGASIIVLKNETYVTITIEDNGKGYDVQKQNEIKPYGGFGLQGIAERVKIVKGTYSVTSLPGKGTTIVITIPINEAHHG